MHTIFQDLRYAARMLRNRPGFTLVAVITLSLGIGANTAIFSVVNAVVLNPLPFPHPEQIVLVRDDLTGRQLEDIGMSVDELKDFQERSGVFDQVSAVWSVDANLTGTDRPERVDVGRHVLGTKPGGEAAIEKAGGGVEGPVETLGKRGQRLMFRLEVCAQIDDVEPCPGGKLERQIERFIGHLALIGGTVNALA